MMGKSITLTAYIHVCFYIYIHEGERRFMRNEFRNNSVIEFEILYLYYTLDRYNFRTRFVV